MIIPIRCFTCNKIISSKYKEYKRLSEIHSQNEDIITLLDNDKINQQIKINKEEILEKIGVERMCCTRHLLTHVDLIYKI